ncbi:MAG: alpha/beta fold hydrolase, partial [Pseudomonadota bacterium]
MARLFFPLALSVCLAVAALAALMLERQSAGLAAEEIRAAGSPVTLLMPEGLASPPLVVIAHGYGGSRQMMRPIALTLARAGFAAASFDFHGHGRHTEPMAGDVTAIDGTTEQLVRQTLAVTEALAARPELGPPVAMIGHSMATDIVVRAAERRDDGAAVIALSMYSDAVTQTHPARLLVISGEYENRLREIALDRVHQVDPTAAEGELARAGEVSRQAIYAPWAGHVGVLYAPTTLVAVRDWLEGAATPLPNHGFWLVVLLGAVLASAWPLSRLVLPDAPPGEATPLSRRDLALAILAPLPVALGAAALVPSAALGLAGFGPLTAFFGAWGLVQGGILLARGATPGGFSAPALFLLLAWGLGAFALALDRYGAAFLPTGPRLGAMGLLLLGTFPFALAEALLARVARWPTRYLAKFLVLATLLAMLFVVPGTAPAFTVLPVLVLFWAVYGAVGYLMAVRAGPLGPG